MMNTVELAWTADPETPEEKLVLLALAWHTYRTPRENLAIIGMRALRKTACGMTPAELDMVLTSLERQGYITPFKDPTGPVGRRIAVLDREHAEDGPWKAWHLNINSKETGR